MRITYKDVKLYQKCPLLFSRFKDGATGTPKALNQIEAMARTAFYRIFMREMELGYKPSSEAALNVFKTYLKNNKENVNLLLRIRQIYNLYINEIYDMGFRALSLETIIDIRVDMSWYIESIPLILYSITDGSIVPVYSPADVLSPARDNYYRFNAVLLSKLFHKNVTDYYIVNSFDVERYDFRLLKYRIGLDEIEKAGQGLAFIVKQMQSRIQLPTTSHCFHCDFIKECKL